MNNLKDFIIEYDWDTRFLWLISHANIINPQNNLIEIYENSIFREYGKLVKLTFSILEKLISTNTRQLSISQTSL